VTRTWPSLRLAGDLQKTYALGMVWMFHGFGMGRNEAIRKVNIDPRKNKSKIEA
jgi:hypothetical protein